MAAFTIREDRSSDSERSEHGESVLDSEQEQIQEAQFRGAVAQGTSPYRDQSIGPPDSNLLADDIRNIQAAEQRESEEIKEQEAEAAKKAAGAGAKAKKKAKKKEKKKKKETSLAVLQKMRLRL